MIESVNGYKVKLTASILDPWQMDVLYARMEFLRSCGWGIHKREYRHEDLTLEVILEKDTATVDFTSFLEEAPQVRWSRLGPCPISPAQFEAIYNDEEIEA